MKRPKALDRVVPRKMPSDYLDLGLADVFSYPDLFIRQRGMRALYTPHVVCACIDPPRSGGTGEPVPNCSSCHGSGVFYSDQHTKETTILVSGQSAEEYRDPSGTLAEGQINVVAASDFQLAITDRIWFPDMSLPVRMVRTYEKRYGGIPISFPVLDVEIIVCRKMDKNNVVGSSVLERGKDYTLDTDDNFIVFGKDSQVLDGMTVSAVLLGRPFYIITDLSSAFRARKTRTLSIDGEEVLVRLPQSARASRADALHGREKEFRSRRVRGDGQ